MKALSKITDLVTRITMSGFILSMPLIGASIEHKNIETYLAQQETQQETQKAQSQKENYKTTPGFFFIKYKGEWHPIPVHQIYGRVIKKGDSIEKWWVGEGNSPKDNDLAKLIFLTVNPPEYYPPNFPDGFDLEKDDITLIKDKTAYFVDLNNDGKIFWEQANLVPIRDVYDILDLKDNKGELINVR